MILLTVPRSVRRGEAVHMRVLVENSAAHSVYLYLRGLEPTLDLLVVDVEGRPVWHRLAGAAIPAVVKLQPLGRSEVLELGAQWDQRGDDGAPVAAGEYAITARLLVDRPEPLSSDPVILRITQ